MPLYMIERNFSERLDVTLEAVGVIEAANAHEDVRWIFSFLSVDHRKTYCLYEAPSADALRAAARRANLPADEIVLVGDAVSADSIRAALGGSPGEAPHTGLLEKLTTTALG